VGDHRIVRLICELLDGTLVRCEIDGDTSTTQLDIFHAFSPPHASGTNRSTVKVTLFEQGPNFVSRTEAKRLAAELESFTEVEIDLRGMEQVGQGFADELFRVWQDSHPQTRLIPINSNPAIDALLRISSAQARNATSRAAGSN
jgi:hypothetical protein